MKSVIHQIYYLQDQLDGLDPSFVPYDNTKNSDKEWREYHVFKEAFASGLIAENQLTGLVSWKFRSKTNISGKEFLDFIKKRPGYDFYFVNPYPLDVIIYKNIWDQGCVYHPNFINITQAVFENAGINVPIKDIISLLSDTGLCNYFVASREFWLELLKLGNKIEDSIRNKLTNELRNIIHLQADKRIQANYIPFIFERIFPLILRSGKFKYIVYPITITRLIQLYGNEKGTIFWHCWKLKEKAALTKKIKDWGKYNKLAECIRHYELNGWTNDAVNFTLRGVKSLGFHFGTKKYLNRLAKSCPPDIYNYYASQPSRCHDLTISQNDTNKEIGTKSLATYRFTSPYRPKNFSVPSILQKYVCAPAVQVNQDQLIPITNLMYHEWCLRPDLQIHYDLNTKNGRFGFVDWYLDHSRQELFVDRTTKIKVEIKRKLGVNLIGFSSAALGLGEDLRTLANCLIKENIPINIFELKYPNSSGNIDLDLQKYVTNQLHYPISIFNLPATEQYRLRYDYGDEIFKSTYNIGYWPWEFSSFPKEYQFCFDVVDEIWGISKFISESFKSATKKSVFWMPLCIQEKIPTETHFQFNHSKVFKFFFNFDFNSSIIRKNPESIIKAFKIAFPQNANVSLILKCIRGQEDSEQWAKLINVIDKDERIKIINKDFMKGQYLELMNSCDAYISLHRSEGFGRGMAEAMLLRKPVICTNYSGNKDYCNPDTAFLVDYELRKIRVNEYPFAVEGIQWAEPNIIHAAKQLREVVENSSLVKIRITNGYNLIQKKHSIEACSKRYSKRIKEVYCNILH